MYGNTTTNADRKIANENTMMSLTTRWVFILDLMLGRMGANHSKSKPEHASMRSPLIRLCGLGAYPELVSQRRQSNSEMCLVLLDDGGQTGKTYAVGNGPSCGLMHRSET